MREKWRKAIVFVAATSIVCSQSAISNVFAAGEDDVTIQSSILSIASWDPYAGWNLFV